MKLDLSLGLAVQPESVAADLGLSSPCLLMCKSMLAFLAPHTVHHAPRGVQLPQLSHPLCGDTVAPSLENMFRVIARGRLRVTALPWPPSGIKRGYHGGQGEGRGQGL